MPLINCPNGNRLNCVCNCGEMEDVSGDVMFHFISLLIFSVTEVLLLVYEAYTTAVKHIFKQKNKKNIYHFAKNKKTDNTRIGLYFNSNNLQICPKVRNITHGSSENKWNRIDWK